MTEAPALPRPRPRNHRSATRGATRHRRDGARSAARGLFLRPGIMGPDDKPKPAATADKPAADTITPQDVSAAKDHATRGQVLAHSGKLDEALAEFEQALTADPYNIQAYSGRALIYQGRGQHQQAIDDFTAASGLTPQKAEPLAGRATSYLALDKAKQARHRPRRSRADRSEQRGGVERARAGL